MEILRATNSKQADFEDNSNILPPPQKRNIAPPQLRWRNQHTLQEDGTDHAWPNP
jgi:hypothetical protein